MSDSGTARKSADAFRTISEVADALKLPQHVLRFWETRFVQIKPLKRGGGRRFYRPQDVELLAAIRKLLYAEGYTIRGVQRILKEQGPRAVAALAQGPDAALEEDGEPGAEAQASLAEGPGEANGFSAPDEVDAALPRFEATRVGNRRASPAPRQNASKPARPASVDPTDGLLPGADHPLDDNIAALRAVLTELAECRSILDAARG